jgi:AraC-like DNA-binding protein/TolB-like protein
LAGPDDPHQSQVLPRCVARALREMRMAPGRDFDLVGLARIGGVSPRTLQRRFRQALGKGPLAVLQDIRFEYTRRELLRGAADARVTEIANRSGFAHLGRFSVEYARRFGEKPSQTLRRQNLFADASLSNCNVVLSVHDGPAVVIAPIDATGPNGEAAKSLVEELSTELMRHGVAVTGRSGAAQYRLHLFLRDEGTGVRLISRLVEAQSDRHLWAHRYEAASRDDLFHQRAAGTIAAALQSGLRAAEIRRARQAADTDATARDLALRALPYALALDADGNTRALDLLGRAIDRDPEHRLAIALASWCHAQRAIYHFSDAAADHRVRAADLAQRIAGAANDATVLAILGNALALLDRIDAAEVVIRRALDICGSSSWAWARSGLIDVCHARPDSAIERLHIAVELVPDDPLKLNSFIGIGAAHFQARRFAQAAYWYERALFERPSAIWIHELLCPAYVHCGRRVDAGNSGSTLRHRYPDLTIARVQAGMPFFTDAFRDAVGNGLEAIGLRP